MWQKKNGPLDIKVAGKKSWQPAQTFCLLGASYFWKESVEERFIDLFPAVYPTEKIKFVRLAVESISLILIKIKIADSFYHRCISPFRMFFSKNIYKTLKFSNQVQIITDHTYLP